MPIDRTQRFVPTGVGVERLPLTPEEYFVLSRLDGRTTINEVAAATGIDGARAEQIVERLLTLGAISPGSKAPSSGPPRVASGPSPASSNGMNADGAPPTRQDSGRQDSGPNPAARDAAKARRESALKAQMGAMAATPTARGVGPEAPRPVPDPPVIKPKIESLALVPGTDSRIDASLDLPVDEQRRLLAIHDALPRFDAFDVLGMVPSTDAKLVKRAFHVVSRRYHPDSYYGKQLGTFRTIMTDLFRRAKQAFDELEDDTARARAHAIAMTAHVPVRARAMTPAAPAVTHAAAAAQSGSHAAAQSGPHAVSGSEPSASMRARLSTPTEIPRMRAMTPPVVTDGGGASARARQHTPSDREVSRAAPFATPEGDEERDARDAERRRRIAERMGMSDAQRQRAVQYAEQARGEEASGRFGAAASLWRLAKEADPSTEEYHARWQASLTSARVTRAHQAFSQALALRKMGDLEAAERLFVDAAEANPTAQHLAEAAYAVRETDAVKARNFAMSALDASIAAQQSGKPLSPPERGRLHVCAAAAFLAAGQQHSARQQVGEARALIPEDEDLKRLLKSMKLT